MSLSPRLIKQAQDVLAARNADFEQLAAIAELDPKRDFVGANLRGVIFQAEISPTSISARPILSVPIFRTPRASHSR